MANAKKIRTKSTSLPFVKYSLRRAIIESISEQDYTVEDHERALQFFGGCAYCDSPDQQRYDHVIPVPVVMNGDSVARNIVPACQRCDDSKGKTEFKEWMRNSTSPASLRGRGVSSHDIEARLGMIEEYVGGYRPRNAEELLGHHHGWYEEILHKMDALIDEAKRLVMEIRPLQSLDAVPPDLSELVPTAGTPTYATMIRSVAISQHIGPARTRGDSQVSIVSRDIHRVLGLHRQYANVCQALGGKILREEANVDLLSIDGPRNSSTTRFTYKLR